jgi:O-antigen/teichoic acid export membrane protein
MSIAFNSLRNIVVRSATVGFILLISVLTARLLGPSGSGVYALVTLYSSIGVALLGGMGTTAGYQISNLRRPVPEVVAEVTVLALMAGTAALGISIIAYWAAGWFGQAAPWWLVVVGAAQPGLLVATALTWAFLGADDHRNYSFAILAPSLFTLLLMAPAMLLLPHSSRAALLGWLLAQYAVIGWLWWRGRGVWSPLPLSAVSLASMGALVSFSAISGLANLVSILNLRADMLLTDHFLGTDQVGIYSKAVQLVEGLFFISQAVGVAIVARVGGASRADAAQLVARSIRASLALMAAAGVVLFLLAGLAIPLLFGNVFSGAVTPFRVFIPGVVAWGAANLLATFFTNQLGRPRVPLIIAGISLAINVVLCLIFIPMTGIAGGAIATTVSYTVAIAVELAWFRRETGLSWQAMLVLDRDDIRDAAQTVRTALSAARGIVSRRSAASDVTDIEPDPTAEAVAEPLFHRVSRTGQ